MSVVDAFRCPTCGDDGHRCSVSAERPHTAPLCPVCGKHALRTDTRFGVRDGCCGLVAWRGGPLREKPERRTLVSRVHRREYRELNKRKHP